MDGERRFKGEAVAGPHGSVTIALPFDPHEVWGRKPRHLVGGAVDGRKFRADAASGSIVLTRMWRRDTGVEPGAKVDVVVWPEGPQRAALDGDIASALAAEPTAALFWDGLAQFYRKGWLTWIGGTKNRPDVRARRIAELVVAMKSGVKARK
jgi:hypothetical protein